MLFNLICFITICLVVSNRLHSIREAERALYCDGRSLKKELSVEEIQDYWKDYKIKVNVA